MVPQTNWPALQCNDVTACEASDPKRLRFSASILLQGYVLKKRHVPLAPRAW